MIFTSKTTSTSACSSPYEMIEVNDFFNKHYLFKDNFTTCGFVNTVGLKNSETFLLDEVCKENIKRGWKYFHSTLINNEQEKIKLLVRLQYRSLKNIHFRNSIRSETKLHMNGICIPGENKIFVNCDGNIFICEKIDSFSPIGTVQHGLNASKIHELIILYYNNLIKKCKNCWARYFCSLCFVSIEGENKWDFSLKEEFCKIHRKEIESSIRTYLSIREKNPKMLEQMFIEE